MPRQPKGSFSTNLSKADGKWHTWVNLGRKPDGKYDRRNVRGDTAEESAEAAKALLARAKRSVAIPTKIETVAQWMEYWIHHVVKDEVKWKTWETYELMGRLHVLPAIGAWKLDGRDRLQPEHLRHFYNELKTKKRPDGKTGYSNSYRHQIHEMIKRALRQAVLEGKASLNVADMVKGPTTKGAKKIKAHKLNEIQAIIRAALDDELAERWIIGMLLGPRQGEALALRWHRVHLDPIGPYFEIAKQVQRKRWQHGCGDPVGCVKYRTDKLGKPIVVCRTKPCPPKYVHGCSEPQACKKLAHFCPNKVVVPGECSTHRTARKGGKKCPELCKQDCTRHASTCSNPIEGGLIEEDVKTEAGVREVPLFKVVAEMLQMRREDQMRRGVYEPDGLVFRSPFGGFIDPRRDHAAWEQLLRTAGVADSRLHAARHTAGTLLASKASIEVAQEILGHTDIRSTRPYVDIARELKANAINDIAAALFDGDLAKLLQPSVQQR